MVPNIFTMGQCAKLSRVSVATVTRWFDSGMLRGYRIPGSQDRRVPKEYLVRFLKEHRMHIPDELDEPKSDDTNQPVADVASAQPKSDIGPGWHRETFLSFWAGQQLELIVLQNGGSSENWKWTARGWRRPDEGDGADQFGWLEETSREKAEAAAIRWYMQKDE